MSTTLKSFRVLKTIFDNNGYVVINCDEIDEKQEACDYDVVCTGPNLPTEKGAMFSAETSLSKTKYGDQYKITAYELLDPSETEAILHLLCSCRLPGIGKTRAKKIVDFFKEDTLKVLDEDFYAIKKIRGIPKDLEKAKEKWEESRKMRNLITILSKISNIGSERIKKINELIDGNLDTLKENPYIITNVKGVSYEQAEKLAKSFDNYSPYKKERIKSAIVQVLTNDLATGNVFMLSNEVKKQSLNLLNKDSSAKLDDSLVCSVCNDLLLSGDIRAIPLNNSEGAVYLKNYYFFEREAADIVANRLKKSVNEEDTEVEELITEFEKKERILLEDSQREAVRTAINNSILIITGGPGRGKTTIIKCILYCLKNSSFCLLAPTGMASRRMSESTGEPAQTIHSRLQIRDSEDFLDDENTIQEENVIVDECSMIDTALFYNLISSCKKVKRLILIGDVDQLASVGCGSVLAELIDSGVVPTVKLEKSFRFGESLIFQNAENINNGNTELLYGNGFEFYEENSLEGIEKSIIDLYLEKVKKEGLDNVSILTPFRKNSILGSNLLNLKIRDIVNPDGEKIFLFGREFRVGDKVMCTVNYSEKNLSNGDVGYVKQISKSDEQILVEFTTTSEIFSTLEEIDSLTLAYAITIHKSQGSEYNSVLIPSHNLFKIMFKRNLIYTACTRAKKEVLIVGSKQPLKTAILNNNYVKRNTLFSYFLRRYCNLNEKETEKEENKQLELNV